MFNTTFRHEIIVFVILDAFSYYVTTKPTPEGDAETAADILFKNWFIIVSPPKFLDTDKGSEYSITVISSTGKIFGFEHRSRYLHTLWANGLVGSQNTQPTDLLVLTQKKRTFIDLIKLNFIPLHITQKLYVKIRSLHTKCF